MISQDKSFIFIHIPNTGGTSIAYAMRKFGLFLQGEENYHSIYFKHASAIFLKEQLGDEFDDYYKFTIVRNPWDWIVSNYFFNRGIHQPFLKNQKYSVTGEIPYWAKEWSFEHWLEWWLIEFEPSQSGMITDTKGNIIVDQVLRFEVIRMDFVKLCLQLRIFPRLLPHINSNSRKNYKSMYNAKTKKMVAKYFQEDIELFEYRH